MKFTKKKVVIAATVLVATIVLGIFWKNNKEAPIAYSEIEVERGNLATTILSTGVVEPENRLDIKPPIAGRAEQILVKEGQTVKKGRILFWMSSTERAALLDAARARGLAELKQWEQFYKATPVLAPIDGAIILRNIQPGQTFTIQDSVLVMSDRLTIQAQVDETDIAQIALKQSANILLDAYPDDTIPGEVDKIAYDAKTVNNVTTYIVDVLPKETPAFMRSGMTANVSFLIDTKKDVLILPMAAIKTKEGRNFVALATHTIGNHSKEVEVKTGITDGKKVEIISGLTEGEKVLVPQFKVRGQGSTGTSPFSPYGKPKQRSH